jgi:hypothetical protein
MTQYRTLQRVLNARAASDGDGVKINRIAGRDVMGQIDPFLLSTKYVPELNRASGNQRPPNQARSFP